MSEKVLSAMMSSAIQRVQLTNVCNHLNAPLNQNVTLKN